MFLYWRVSTLNPIVGIVWIVDDDSFWSRSVGLLLFFFGGGCLAFFFYSLNNQHNKQQQKKNNNKKIKKTKKKKTLTQYSSLPRIIQTQNEYPDLLATEEAPEDPAHEYSHDGRWFVLFLFL